jgi:hypothetical protein
MSRGISGLDGGTAPTSEGALVGGAAAEEGDEAVLAGGGLAVRAGSFADAARNISRASLRARANRGGAGGKWRAPDRAARTISPTKRTRITSRLLKKL